MSMQVALAAYVAKMESEEVRDIETRRLALARRRVQSAQVPTVVLDQANSREKQSEKERLRMRLDRKVQNRPAQNSLRDRNILQGGANVSAQLVASQEALKKEQLRVSLGEKIDVRPSPDNNRVRRMRSADPSQNEMSSQRLTDASNITLSPLKEGQPLSSPKEKINTMFKQRPTRRDLMEKNIIPGGGLSHFKESLRVPNTHQRVRSEGSMPMFENRLSGHWSNKSNRNT